MTKKHWLATVRQSAESRKTAIREGVPLTMRTSILRSVHTKGQHTLQELRAACEVETVAELDAFDEALIRLVDEFRISESYRRGRYTYNLGVAEWSYNDPTLFASSAVPSFLSRDSYPGLPWSFIPDGF